MRIESRHRSSRRAGALVLALALAGFTSACTGDPGASGPPAADSATAAGPPATPHTSAPSPAAKSTTPVPPPPVVLAISVDGLNPDAIVTLEKRGRVPTLRRLAAEGSFTLNARSLVERTITLPNHTGMLTGRPVDGPDGTGVRFNKDNGRTLVSSAGHYVPGIFDVAHDRGVHTAMFAGKHKFDFLARSWDDGHGEPDEVGHDDGRDKVDEYAVDTADRLVDRVTRALRGRGSRLVFWHLAAPDVAGHAHGFLGRAYLDAVAAVDDDLGRVLAYVDAHPALAQRLTVLLTADHGGSGKGHSDRTRVADYRVPFLAWGRGVQAHGDLYDLNPGREDPGNSRPGYGDMQPIRNLDLADAALRSLGLPSLPDSYPGEAGPLRLR